MNFGTPSGRPFVSFVVPNACQIGGILESCLESFSGTPEFQYLVTLTMKNSLFEVRGHPKSEHFSCVFEGGFWQPSGKRFLEMLLDFGLPRGGHLAPKRGPGRECKKVQNKVF